MSNDVYESTLHRKGKKIVLNQQKMVETTRKRGIKITQKEKEGKK